LVLIALLGACTAYKLKVEYRTAGNGWTTYFDQCDIEVPLFMGGNDDDDDDRGFSYLVETEIQTTVQFDTYYRHTYDDEEDDYRIHAFITPEDDDDGFTGLFEEAEAWRVTFEEQDCMEGRTPFDCEFYMDTQMEYDTGYRYYTYNDAECDTNGVYFEGEFEASDLWDDCDVAADNLRPIFFHFELSWSLPFEMLDKEQACVCHFCQADGDPIFPEDCAENCADYCDIEDLCDDSCELNIRFRDGICNGIDADEPSYDYCYKRREDGKEMVSTRFAGMKQKHSTPAVRMAKAARKAAKIAASK